MYSSWDTLLFLKVIWAFPNLSAILGGGRTPPPPPSGSATAHWPKIFSNLYQHFNKMMVGQVSAYVSGQKSFTSPLINFSTRPWMYCPYNIPLVMSQLLSQHLMAPLLKMHDHEMMVRCYFYCHVMHELVLALKTVMHEWPPVKWVVSHSVKTSRHTFHKSQGKISLLQVISIKFHPFLIKFWILLTLLSASTGIYLQQWRFSHPGPTTPKYGQWQWDRNSSFWSIAEHSRIWRWVLWWFYIFL